MYIYRFTNLTNGKVNIGQSKRLSGLREREHVLFALAGKRYCPRFYSAIRKYGPDAFKVEQIYHAKTLLELNRMETFFILLHQSHKPENGYNMTLGGDSRQPTPEVRGKISQTMKRQGVRPGAKNLKLFKAYVRKPKSKSHKLAIAATWNDPGRREAQAAIARRVNNQENYKLNDHVCPTCLQEFKQITRSVYGGHRKACLAKEKGLRFHAALSLSFLPAG